MAAISYGHVAIVPKGTWNATTQYEVCNLVEYDGSSYVVTSRPPIGTLPTDKTYWQVSAAGTAKATENTLGLVKADNTSTEVDENGQLSVKSSDDIIKNETGNLVINTTFEQATELANIIAGEAIKEVLGKVSKSIATTMNLDQNALLKSMVSSIDTNDENKVPSSALLHTMYERLGMGTDLSSGFTSVTQAVNQLNSNFTETITDLNELFLSKQSDQTIAIRIFNPTAVGSPDNYASGMVISFRDNKNYGSQLAIANGAIYSRQKTNGVWENWAK